MPQKTWTLADQNQGGFVHTRASNVSTAHVTGQMCDDSARILARAHFGSPILGNQNIAGRLRADPLQITDEDRALAHDLDHRMFATPYLSGAKPRLARAGHNAIYQLAALTVDARTKVADA